MRVLRLRDGEPVTASDGAGSWLPCRLRLSIGAEPALEPDGPVTVEPAPTPEVAVAVALPKGERGDWAVQKLTEVGADIIVPLLARRGVVRWEPERLGRARERMERVIRAAAMQSRRVRLPALHEPVEPSEVVAGRPGQVCVAEIGGSRPDLTRPFVLVGPEGGWEPDEIPASVPRVGLGPTVLRSETAAVVVAAVLGLLRHGE